MTIESDGRTSKADEMDYDDANSIAVLRGNPATSEKDGELFQGKVITYFLDSNDVQVEGDIQGELELDIGDSTLRPARGDVGGEDAGDTGVNDDFGEGTPNGDDFGNGFDEERPDEFFE